VRYFNKKNDFIIQATLNVSSLSSMVKLHIKKGDESQFLLETTVDVPVDDLMAQLIPIYNGRLKVHRICAGEHLPLKSRDQK
jgi:hypothetical protein